MSTISPNNYFTFYKSLFGICFLLHFLTACKKETGFNQTNFNQQKATAITYKEYIDSVSMIDSNAKHLSNTLLWNNLVSITLDSSKKLVYVPSSLRTRSNIVNGLVFIESIVGDSIMQSFYTQTENLNSMTAVYRTAIEKYEVVESVTTIANYFTRTKNKFNGSIQFFTNRNKYLFTIGIENGTASYFKAINKAKKGNKEGGIQANSDCVDYYLTTFYDDGSTETEFLFQSCTRDCIQTKVINISGEAVTTMACGDNITSTGGGGDGGVDFLAIAIPRTATLKFISKIINEDGSITYEFVDPNSLLMSTVHIRFIIDKNGLLVQGKEKIFISGIFAIDQNEISYKNSSIIHNSGILGTTEVKLELSGLFTFRAIDVFSQFYNIKVNVTIRAGNFFIPEGTITYIPWSQVYQKYIR